MVKKKRFRVGFAVGIVACLSVLGFLGARHVTWPGGPGAEAVSAYQDASGALREAVMPDVWGADYSVMPGGGSAVFITVSRDTEEVLPVIRHAVGKDVADAWDSVDKLVRDAFRSGEFEEGSVRYLKCDIVREATDMPYESVRDELSRHYIGMWPYGVAFDGDFDVALLQQEWSHYRLYDPEQNNFLLSRLGPYLSGQYGQELESIPDTVTAFRCDSWLYDAADGFVTRLSGDDENYGIRDFELSRENLELMVRTAGYYLVNNVTLGGRFEYAYWPQAMDYTSAYSTVRHIDALWALTQYFELTGDDGVRDVLDAGIAFLEPYTLDFGDRGMYVRCSDRDELPEEIRMGGSGLLLVVLSEYERLFGSDAHRALLDGVATGILSQIQPDGHVPHVLNTDLSVSRDPWAQYYDGQTLLGLCYAYKTTGNPDYLDGAERIAGYDLAEGYATTGDHWFVLGMDALTDILPDRAEYYEAGLLAIARQDDLFETNQDPTRLEKLMGGFELYRRAVDNGILIPDEFDAGELVSAVRVQAKDLLNCYLFPEKAMYSPVLDGIIGTFYTEVPDGWKIRIDLIQHHMDAYYRMYCDYDKLFGT